MLNFFKVSIFQSHTAEFSMSALKKKEENPHLRSNSNDVAMFGLYGSAGISLVHRYWRLWDSMIHDAYKDAG